MTAVTLWRGLSEKATKWKGLVGGTSGGAMKHRELLLELMNKVGPCKNILNLPETKFNFGTENTKARIY